MTSEPQSPQTEPAAEISAPGSSHESTPTAAPPSLRRHSRWRRVVKIVAALLAVYLLVAYALLPVLWSRYGRRHPSLEDIPGITYTGDGHPGDPLNVALIGTREQMGKIMEAAGWHPANPLSMRNDLHIAIAAVLGRPYPAAPVSNLYLFGRREDLAFEQPIGNDPRKRNHVRFWKTDRADPDGRPVWIGSATRDERVGFSYTTGQITHHIAPDVDAERDHLFQDLEHTKDLVEVYVVPDFHKIREGRNGGGDPWHTDGKLYVGVISPALH
jgi:hypothetical protein